MPSSPIDLRNPRVVIVVAVLLLVVAAVNLQTFLPRFQRNHAGETAWDPDAFVPPADTAELTRVAATRVTGADAFPAGPATVAGADLGGGLRDPFRTGGPTTSSPARLSVPTPLTSTVAPSPAPVARGFVCTAILCAGPLATAVIDGKKRQVGDAVGEWRVVAIDAAGVQLRSPRGEMLLRVGGDGQGATRYPLVTQSAADAAGNTTILEPVPGSREP